MALNFPYPASPGDVYTYGSIIYTYDGVKWIANVPETQVDRITATDGGGSTANLVIDPYLNINLTYNDIYYGYMGFDETDDFYLTDNRAGGNIYLSTRNNSDTNSFQWTLDSTGNLVLPSNDSSINYANGDPYGRSFSTWKVLGQDDLVASGHDTVEFVAGPGIVITTDANNDPKQISIESKITIDSTDPNIATEGAVWFNSELGRSFVKYDGQWVDMSPQQVPPDAANPFDQDLNTTDSVQFHNINAGNVTINDLDSTTGNIGNLRTNALRTANLHVDDTITVDTVNAGNVTANYFIGDGSQLTNLPIPEANNAIQVSDIAPNANIEGTQWFNSVDGRTYVAYNNQWVDASPQTAINPDIQLNSITFPDGSIQTKSSDLGNLAVGDYATLYDTNTNNNLNLNEGNLGDVSLRSFRNDVKITSDYINTSATWNFNSDGNLVLPNGGKVGPAQTQNGVDLYADDSHFWVQLNYNNQAYMWLEEDVAGFEIQGTTWFYTSDGRIIFPDGTVQETAYPGETLAKVAVDDYPPSAEEGSVWFNTELGRAFVKYNNQWVDFSPQTAINPNLDVQSITFPDGTIQTTASSNANVTTDRLVNGNSQVTLNNDGTLTIPGLVHLNYNNSEVGFIQTVSNGFGISGAFNNTVAITTDANTGTSTWQFEPGGNIRFPDGTLQNTAYTGQTTDNNISVSDVAPEITEDGKLWFNTIDAKTYVSYNNQWVDSNPQVVDAKAIRTDENNDVEFPRNVIASEGRFYVDATYGKTSMRWVNMTDSTDMIRVYHDGFSNGTGNEQQMVAGLGLSYQDSNTSGLFIKGFKGGAERRWTFEGNGNITFPDDTVQTTAYRGEATLLDGGGANSTYVSNIPLPIGTNPFDQSLNTNDTVQFSTVIANEFFGTVSTANVASFANFANVANTAARANIANTALNISYSNVSGLGNIATINLSGSSSDVLYGNGVFSSVQMNYQIGSQQLVFDTSRVNPPTVSGSYDRITLYPASAGQHYYGIGIEHTYTWFNTGEGGVGYKFYNQGNLAASIDSAGVHTTGITANNHIQISGEGKGITVDAGSLKRFGFMKYSGIEGSLVHTANVGNAVPLRIGRTTTLDVTAATVSNFTTEIYVGTNGHVRIADDNVNNINDPTERLEVTGNIKATGNIISTGNVVASGNVNVTGNVVFNDSTAQSTAYRPVAAPTTSKGSSGDKAGMVAFDNSNFYYCKADYVPALTSITLTVNNIRGPAQNAAYANNGGGFGTMVGFDGPLTGLAPNQTFVYNTVTYTIQDVSNTSNPYAYVVFTPQMSGPVTASITAGTQFTIATGLTQPDIWVKTAWTSTSW